VKRTASSGFIVANFYDEVVMDVCTEARARVIDYGFTNLNCYHITDVALRDGKQTFQLFQGGTSIGEFSLQITGLHTVMNATAVIATARELGVATAVIQEALAGFTGLARRMERLGEHSGAAFYDDYAHHPTEVAATLAAARERWPDKTITAVFMPHMYSRTKALYDEFADSFRDADRVILLPIYASAREVVGDDITSETLAKKIGKKAQFVPGMQQAADKLRDAVGSNDVVVLMGAGDAFRVWDLL
jgi:UDP-N-acetylmuramate--alanine ligase